MIPVDQIKAVVQSMSPELTSGKNSYADQVFEDTEAYIAELILAGTYQVSIDEIQDFFQTLKKKIHASETDKDKEGREEKEDQEEKKRAEDKIQEIFLKIKKLDHT